MLKRLNTIVDRFLPSRLYLRFAVVLALLLALVTGSATVLHLGMFHQGDQEAVQIAGWAVAEQITAELQPLLEEPVNSKLLMEAMHDIVAINPQLGLHVLDANGVAQYSCNFNEAIFWLENVEERTVAPVPIPIKLLNEFLTLDLKRQRPMLGPVPNHPTFTSPISVAPIRIGGAPGYMYVALTSEYRHYINKKVRNYYLIFGGIFSSALLIVFVAGVGTFLFYILSRRFYRLLALVSAIAGGDFARRLPESGKDEISDLARSINKMAATIEESFDELKRQDRLRRDLVADVSHEIGSPLSALNGYLELLCDSDKGLSEEQRSEYLNTARQNTTRLKQLASELLQLSKLEAKEIEPKVEPFNVAELITEEVVPRHLPKAQERNISIRADVPDSCPFIIGDPNLVERVITNLVSNAIRYGSDNGSVDVRLRIEKEKLLLTVEDDGMGIPSVDLPHIFDRFYRASSTSKIRGTGLGLAIVKGIVDAHGEEISVVSREGEGTTFAVTFSVEPE